MAIPPPVANTTISTTAWGIPMTDEVNDLRTDMDEAQTDIATLESTVAGLPVSHGTSATTTFTTSGTGALVLTAVSKTITVKVGQLYLTQFWLPLRFGSAAVGASLIASLRTGATLIATVQAFKDFAANERFVMVGGAQWNPAAASNPITLEVSTSLSTVTIQNGAYGWVIVPVAT